MNNQLRLFITVLHRIIAGSHDSRVRFQIVDELAMPVPHHDPANLASVSKQPRSNHHRSLRIGIKKRSPAVLLPQ